MNPKSVEEPVFRKTFSIKRMVEYYHFRTSLLISPHPFVFALSDKGMNRLLNCRKHSPGAKELSNLQRMFSKISKCIASKTIFIFDCGTELGKNLPLFNDHQHVTSFPSSDYYMLPSVEVLLAEVRAILCCLQEGAESIAVTTTTTDNNNNKLKEPLLKTTVSSPFVMVLVNNRRHFAALFALVKMFSTTSTTFTVEDLLVHFTRLLFPKKSVALISSLDRNDEFKLRAGFFLFYRQPQISFCFLQEISISTTDGSTEWNNSTRPFLLILNEDNLVVFSGSPSGDSLKEAHFQINRTIQNGGFFLQLRSNASMEELTRIWVHTQMLGTEHIVSTCGQFSFAIHVLASPPIETDEEEEVNTESYSSSLQRDELMALSLQFEEEGHDSGSGHINWLPISSFVPGREEEKCMICQYAFKAGNEVRRLPCFHQFHPGCVDPWFIIKANCPLCQHSILDALEQTSNHDRF